TMQLWCDERIVVEVDSPAGCREVVVPGPLARIGAHPSSEVILTGEGVPQRVFYLHATADGIYCLNLDIEEGSLEDRGRWLASSETLTVGPYRLRVRRESDAESAACPALPGPVAWGSATAPLPVMNIFCSKILKDKRRFRARLNVLGRRPQCSLQLRGPK